MRLRNKKTGEIRVDSDLGKMLSRYEMPSYESISELCEEWEDYKPAEPLIKDEKIRKAVRAWAEANNLSRASTCESCSDTHYWYIRVFDDSERGIDLDIWGDLPKELTECKFYTIEELCGEDEK